ncbi:hypothetical protein GCM10010244_71960 [Streptomyces coeruleorubidus]|nr:hypothetical protein GCM10010244_71960 [Streptomyces bellus]
MDGGPVGARAVAASALSAPAADCGSPLAPVSSSTGPPIEAAGRIASVPLTGSCEDLQALSGSTLSQ